VGDAEEISVVEDGWGVPQRNPRHVPTYGDGAGYTDGNISGDGAGDGLGHTQGNGSGAQDGTVRGAGPGDGDSEVNYSQSSLSDSNGYNAGNGSAQGDGNGLNWVWVSPDTPILAYWVFGGDRHRVHLGKKLGASPGQVHVWPWEPELCRNGLHASLELRDARRYRGRGVAYRVRCSGWVKFQRDKLVCTRREIAEEVRV